MAHNCGAGSRRCIRTEWVNCLSRIRVPKSCGRGGGRGLPCSADASSPLGALRHTIRLAHQSQLSGVFCGSRFSVLSICPFNVLGELDIKLRDPMSDVLGRKVHPESLENIFPTWMMVGFVSEVSDLNHEGKDIWKVPEQEGSMQLDPNLARVLRKRPFHRFPIMKNLSECEVNVALSHCSWPDSQWRSRIRQKQVAGFRVFI